MTNDPRDTLTATCVCGHQAIYHHAWTGPCNGNCGCSYLLLDDGSDGGPLGATYSPYQGQYNQHYTLGDTA